MRFVKLRKCISAGLAVCMAAGAAVNVPDNKAVHNSGYIAEAESVHDDDLVLRYDKMAGTVNTDNAWNNSESFYRALPLGNGRIGAMVYGNCPDELIDLNECTVWSSGPGDNNRQGAGDHLKEVQSLLENSKYSEANKIISQYMIGSGQAKYQKVGSLKLSFGHDYVSDYSRQLDMNDAVASSSYTCGGVKYTRETFVSHPDDVMVTRITCDKKGALSMTATYDGVLNGTVTTEKGDTLVANGHADGDLGLYGAVYFSTRSRFINENGVVSTAGGKVTVSGADSLLILTSVRTNFIDYKTCNGDEKGDALADINRVSEMSYDTLYKNHSDDYQELFKRVDIDLGGDSEVTNAKTIETRIAEFSKTNDPKMVKTLFQFGRYLMISASRDAQAMNLQGIWNKYSAPAWGSKSTTNINYEMNYWPAFTTNLAECFEPFVKKAEDLQKTGHETAKVHYGINDGWVLHHNTDIWNRSGPIDGSWGQWPVGGAWISNMLYDAYRFNQDEDYLQEVYPVIKGSAEFLNELMKKETIDGQDYMVISPSASPELPLPGYPWNDNVYCSYGVTMDNSICRELFKDTTDASSILGQDSGFRGELESKLSLIKPETIGKWGQLQEWAYDWDNKNETHRHISHLYSLFPGNNVTPYENETVADAARVSLNARGDAGTGWSEAWKLNCWARLCDGEHAYNFIRLLITPVGADGRLYDNLWDAHPPFQIDGNFGFTSGVAEMLLQSQNDMIQLLPALPSQWKTGHANGLCARGNFEISKMSWSDGKLRSVCVLSGSGGVCSLKYGSTQISFETKAGEEYSLNGNLQFCDDTQTLQNLALNKKVTASGETKSEEAIYAVDGDKTTKWCDMGGLSDEWIQIDLGEAKDIERYVLSLAGTAEDICYNARDFRLQTSINGTDWTDADTVYGNTKSVYTSNIDKTYAQFVRLYFITSTQNNQGGARVYDIELWGTGEAPGARCAYVKTGAESFDFMYGDIQTETSDTGDADIGYITDGSYVVYRNMDFETGPEGFMVSASSDTEGGTIEIRAGGTDGKLLGTCGIAGTQGWQNYETLSCAASECTGKQDVYLIFKGDSGYLFNIEWFSFYGIKGDIDRTSRIGIRDFIYMKDHILSGGSSLTGLALSNADINSDDKVDITDAVILQEFLTGMRSQLE
ncbi:MAG: glycoside hydrolase N-terminal domain-containing protein [Oscillospiraceae bacterium]|nr:glycoside hydrolase N-terminal domain-containing protein [Oscillospiraceae bacterium]